MADIDESSAVSMVRLLYRSSLQADGTDFKIYAGSKTVHCHRMVICAECEYFDAICNTGVMEYSFDEDSVMAEHDGGILAAVIRFFYLGTVALTDENVELILAASDVIEYGHLKETCQLHLLKNLNINNCRMYQDIAEKFQLRNLKNKCLQMVNGELE